MTQATSGTNLTAPFGPFVGRTGDLGALDELFASGARLITIAGAGGAGKTRIAQELGHRRLAALLTDCPGGVWFCELADARTASGICGAIAATLGVPLKGAGDVGATLGEALAARGPVLAILDNFEQVVDWAPRTLGRWLKDAPEVRFIVTSRTPLGLAGERVYRLEPLTLPTPGQQVRSSEAVQLFVEQARLARRGYEPRDDELTVLGQIVRRLDGLPLAIELAAARTRVLTIQQIAEHLERRFELLAGQLDGRVSRHATLRAAIDWSWELLSPPEQAALAQCAHFHGGFDLEAAEGVIDLGRWDDAPPVLDVIQSLHDQSLLQSREPPAGTTAMRYRLYESVRDYAAERLAAAPFAATAARHDAHYCGLARQARQAADGRDGPQALHRLGIELENLLAVHRRATEGSPSPEGARRALEVSAAVASLLLTRGPLPALLGLVDAALAVAEQVPTGDDTDGLVVEVRLARGSALAELGRNDESRQERERALALARARADRRLEGRALTSLARQAWHDGAFDESVARYREAAAAHREVGDRCFEGRTSSHWANALYLKGDVEGARELYREALEILREHGHPESEATALGNLANLEHDLGNAAVARELYEQSLAILRAIGDRLDEGCFVVNLGSLLLAEGKVELAQAHCLRGLSIHREVGNRRWEGITQAYLGQCAELAGRADQAMSHFAEAGQLLRAFGHPLALAMALCWQARFEADTDRLAEAHATLSDAEAKLAELGSTIVSELPRACGAHLELGRARAAERRGDRSEAERFRAAAAEALGRFDGPDIAPSLAQSADLRMAVARLRDAVSGTDQQPVKALVVSESGRAFRIPGGAIVSLATRRAPRLILEALADARVQSPGQALPLPALVAAGWPGERPLLEAAANRVYTAVATLRRMGLKDWLLRRDDGYLLDPSLPLSRCDDDELP